MPVLSHHTALASAAQSAVVRPDCWTQEVLPRLPADLEQQAQAHSALHRHRAFTSASDLLRALLAYVLCHDSFASLGVWAVIQGLADISTTAWRKRLRCASPWLAWLLAALLTNAPTAAPLTRGRRVRLVDATRLRQWRGSGDDWRLHLSYDLGAGRMDQVVVTDYHGAESLQHAALQRGDLCVADAGFGIRASLAILHAHHADGVLRMYPPNFPVEDGTGQRIDLRAWLQAGGAAFRERACWCRYDQQRYPLRVLAFALPPQGAAAKRRRKLKEARSKGRQISASKLFYLGVVVLVTTLDTSWTVEEIFQLYRARWQIELVFKRIKQLLRVQVIRSTTAAQAEATVRLVRVAWALHEQDAQRVRSYLDALHQQLKQAPPGAAALGQALQEPPVSSWLLTSVCLTLLQSQVAGAWSWMRVWECLPRLVRFFCPSPRRRQHQETVIRTWIRQHGDTIGNSR